MKRSEILALAKKAGMAVMATTVVCEIAELERFAELVAGAERVEAELRCAKTPVLLNDHHGYTALKVQEMMMAAVSMRSNAEMRSASAGLPG